MMRMLCDRALPGFSIKRASAAGLLCVSAALTTACSTSKTIERPTPDKLIEIAALTDPAVVWQASIGAGSERSVVRFTPYVSDEAVFALNAKGAVSAFGRDNGTQLWSIDLGFRPTAGIGGDEKYLYVGTGDGKVVSIEQESGDVVWSTDVSSEVISAPVAGSDYVVVRSIDGRVYALDRSSGARRWVYSYAVPSLSLHGNGRPRVLTDGVLVGLDNGRLVALRDTDGRVFWEATLSDSSGRSEIDRLNDLDADPLVNDDWIYAVNYQGAVAQINPANGNRVWSVPMSSVAGMDVNDAVVVVTDEFDTVWAIGADNGEVLWKHENLSNRQLTAPVLDDNGNVIVGDFEGYLHVLSIDGGQAIGRVKAVSAQITSRPVIQDELVYVLDRKGKLAAVSM